MRNQKQLLIEHLNNKLKPFSEAKTVIVPDSGWIKTIRTTLNMTLEQLGGKLNITRQGVRYIEESESSGSISLNALKDVGMAMDMKLVYGFVPIDGSIDSLITRKSRILAKKIILRTNHNMLLEDQQIGEEKLKLAIDELAREIKAELRKTIWD